MSNNKNSKIMEARVIIVSVKKSNKSENNIWAVSITGEKEPKAYCKSAYKAMRFAFLLKARTGLNISDNCLARLSQEIEFVKVENRKLQYIKAQMAKKDEEIAAIAAEQRKEMEEEKAKAGKKQRKPRTKKAKVVNI